MVMYVNEVETKGKQKITATFNPLSANSDQQQFSPNNIHTMSRDKVMSINKTIIIEKIPGSFIEFSQLILKGNVWRSVWRICMWILGLKGLTINKSWVHLNCSITSFFKNFKLKLLSH